MKYATTATVCHSDASASTAHTALSPGIRSLPQFFAACCKFDLNSLLQDPSMLGAFLTASRIIDEIKPEAESAAINFALRGTEIPGFVLVRRENPGYVETTALEELISNCPPARIPMLLAALVQICGHLSGERYFRLCDAIGISPSQPAIKHAGTALFLRQTHNVR
jgi:hypothetical protein